MGGYVLTETAEGELEDILLFIARSSGRDRAEHVLERFVEAFEQLAEFPRIGYHREPLTGPSLRWWPVFVSSCSTIQKPSLSPCCV